jgi:hypothetical protein
LGATCTRGSGAQPNALRPGRSISMGNYTPTISEELYAVLRRIAQEADRMGSRDVLDNGAWERRIDLWEEFYDLLSDAILRARYEHND